MLRAELCGTTPHKLDVGCEGDLAATSVTLLIAKVDSVDLAGWTGVPFLHYCSMCVLPEAASSVEEDGLPQIEENWSSIKGIQEAAFLC